MKVVVRLAIIVAALLLASNMAFADSPWGGAAGDPTCTGDQVFCYAVTETASGGSSFSYLYKFCLNNSGTGTLCNVSAGCVNLTMFGGGPLWFNFDGSPAIGGGNPWWNALMVYSTGTFNFAAYYQPAGPMILLTGLEDWNGLRYIVNGMQTSCP